MKKKKTLAGLYKEKSIIGALAKIKSISPIEDFNSCFREDSEREFTISEIRYRVDQNGSIIPVFTLDELKQNPNLRFRADQLWITDICNEPEPCNKIWIGTGDITKPSLKGLTSYPMAAIKSLDIDYNEGDSVIILIPAISLMVAKKDNGLGEKVNFDEFYGENEIGYNGKDITLDDSNYKLFGQLFLNSGYCRITIK